MSHERENLPGLVAFVVNGALPPAGKLMGSALLLLLSVRIAYAHISLLISTGSIKPSP
jgi:hypothetical protein